MFPLCFKYLVFRDKHEVYNMVKSFFKWLNSILAVQNVVYKVSFPAYDMEKQGVSP